VATALRDRFLRWKAVFSTNWAQKVCQKRKEGGTQAARFEN
jgi:hypothetical protein